VGNSFPYQGWNTTWDVSSYEQWSWNARRAGEDIDDKSADWSSNPGSPWDFDGPQARFDLLSFNKYLGYDPEFGGVAPHPLDFPAEPAAERYHAMPLPDIYTNTPGRSRIVRWGLDWQTSTNWYPATDSASSGTAMSTGFKTDDGNIAWRHGDPEDGSLKTIAEFVREQKGMSIGVVSSVQFTHATPATFVAHNINRNNYSAERLTSGYTGMSISEEIIAVTKPDVVISAGHPDHASRYIGNAEYTALKDGTNPDYVFVERKTGVDGSTAIINGATQVADAISAATGKQKLFGLFGGTYQGDPGTSYRNGYGQPKGTPYEGSYMRHYDPKTDGSGEFEYKATENPTLSASTEAALKVLSQNENGFFLMVEGGDIDWANHANDYEWMIGAWHNFDLACQAAVDFVNQPGDDIDWENTMVIVSTDHGNSYMRLHKYYGKGVLPPGDDGVDSHLSERQVSASTPPAKPGVV
jgi:alkaline phosphatase